jgi:hypothetical protein
MKPSPPVSTDAVLLLAFEKSLPSNRSNDRPRSTLALCQHNRLHAETLLGLLFPETPQQQCYGAFT